MAISLLDERNLQNLKFTALIEALTVSENELQVRALQNEFYRRLQKRFFDRCHKIGCRLYSTFPDWEATRDDIFIETFTIAFNKIHEFEFQDHWDDKECEKMLLYWLAKTANNKFLKRIQQQEIDKENLNKYIHDLLSENSKGTVGKRKYAATYERVKFDEVWLKMNNMSKEILLLSLENETLSEENSEHLPDDIIEYLIKKYKVGKAAIRQAKRRAIKAIKSCKIEK